MYMMKVTYNLEKNKNMQIGTTCMPYLLFNSAFQQMLSCDHWKWLKVHCTCTQQPAITCLHFCVILLFPLQISSFESHWIVRAVCHLIGKRDSKHKQAKHAHWWFITSQFFPTNIRPKCYPFHRDAYFPALLKRSSISNNVFIVWLWSLFTFCSGNSTFNAWSHLWFIIFGFCFTTLTSENPM